MSALNRTDKPTLVVYPEICQENIRRMTGKAKRNGVNFRPHFKTHQSTQIGEWYRNEGVTNITVSSVSMAEYFADAGWNDITIAFPFNSLEIDKINALASRIQLNVIVSSLTAAENLVRLATQNLRVFIEVDAGYHRSGILAENTDAIRTCAEVIPKSNKLSFAGFLAHFGNSYNCRNQQEIIDIWNESMVKIRRLKQLFPQAYISVGDTPCCSVVEDFSGADEIRPGNFVFYDFMQTVIGSCRPENVGVAVHCPVAAVYSERRQAVLYGGAVHLSKDSVDLQGKKVFGWVGNADKMYIPSCYIISLSQEHAIAEFPEGIALPREGEVLAVMPVHSCLTVSCLKTAISSEGERIEIMKG